MAAGSLALVACLGSPTPVATPTPTTSAAPIASPAPVERLPAADPRGQGGLEEPPNVLLIVADDLGYADLGFTGATGADTPTLDAFFRENVAFMHNYTDATCVPTRAGLMTGVHPSVLGYTSVGYALPDGVPTVAERLNGRGYHTEHIGKWHIGWAIPEARPPANGFDEYFGFLDQGFLAGPDPTGEWRHQRPTHFDPWLGTNEEEPRQYEGHLTDLLTRRAVERIRELARSDEPWFMNLWYYAPHTPLEPAPRYVREDTPAGRYLALVEHLDDAVGEVLDALEASGAAEETVVVFLSDNGGTNRELDNNAPFPGAKISYFQGGIRTPMAMRLPDVEGARRVDQPVSYLDVVPTILDAAGAASDTTLQGRSLVPAARGEELPRTPFYWEIHSDALGYAFGVTSRDGRWHYGQDLFTGANTLNDLETDPTGRENLLEALPTQPGYSDVLEGLWRSYREWHDRARLLFEGGPPSGTTVHDLRDVQRTPGFNPVTWSFAVAGDSLSAGPVTIAEQDGVARIVVDGASVEAQVFGEVLRGEWRTPDGRLGPADPTACRTVALSTYSHHPNILSDRSLFRATLYIDGVAVDELERAEAMVGGGEQHAPLTVHSARGAVRGYRIWTEYLEEDDTLQIPGVERATEGLCG